MKLWCAIFFVFWLSYSYAMNSERKKFMEILEQKRSQQHTGTIEEALSEQGAKQKKLLEGLVKTLQINDPDVFYELIKESHTANENKKNDIYDALITIAQKIQELNETSKASLEDQREQGVIDEKERRFNRCCLFYQEFKTAISFIVGVLGSGTVTATALITYFSTTCD